MAMEITLHAKERMRKYGITAKLVKEAVESPSSVLESYGGRKVYQKGLNGYTLRVITEESKGIRNIIVITVYKAKSGRYEIQI